MGGASVDAELDWIKQFCDKPNFPQDLTSATGRKYTVCKVGIMLLCGGKRFPRVNDKKKEKELEQAMQAKQNIEGI
jgi:hypothetical protein